MSDLFTHEKRVLLKSCTFVGGGKKQVDILIEEGIISAIETSVETPNSMKVVDLDGAYVSPGWVDPHVHLREPGREDEETIESGCNAAMAGGFTTLCCMPNTDPPLDSRDMVTSVRKAAEGHLVEVHPIGAVTKGRKGMELAEMGDMVDAGAVGFSDDGNPIENAMVMRHALEYSGMFDVPVINHSAVKSLSEGTVMHEGAVSAKLGLPGEPVQSEDIMVVRDLRLLELTGGRLHVPHVSASSTIDVIRRAKRDGLPVTCEVTPHHFSLTDEAVETFDSNYKVNPPLRTDADRRAILEALADGTVDLIASDHAPHSSEEKEADFLEAPPGMIGLETSFGLAVTRLLDTKVLTLEQLVEKLTTAARRIFRLPSAEIKTGMPADMTLFKVSDEWNVDSSAFLSRSRNTPFDGMKLKGRVVGVMRGECLYLPDNT